MFHKVTRDERRTWNEIWGAGKGENKKDVSRGENGKKSLHSFPLNPSRHPVLGSGDPNGPDLAPGLRRGEGTGTWASHCRGHIMVRKGSSVQLSDTGKDILEEVEPV